MCINEGFMRFKPAPASRRRAEECISLISRQYVIRNLQDGLAAKAISDSAEGNGIDFDTSMVEDLFLRLGDILATMLAEIKNCCA